MAQSSAEPSTGAESVPAGPAGGSAAERARLVHEARCLLRGARAGSLATVRDGQPFASLVTPAMTPDGAVLLFLSELAEHTRHLRQEPRCSLLVSGPPTGPNPQTAPRLTITGEAELDDAPVLRSRWLLHHPYARLYADLPDFAIWRIAPAAGLMVGGFGRALRLSGRELAPDPAAAAAFVAAEPELLSAANTREANLLRHIAAATGASGPWKMIGIDPDGFTLRQDDAILRVNFDHPLADPLALPAALHDLARRPPRR